MNVEKRKPPVGREQRETELAKPEVKIILVRHGEAEFPTCSASLTHTGRNQAYEFGENYLKKITPVGTKIVITYTNRPRTQETAQCILEKLKLLLRGNGEGVVNLTEPRQSSRFQTADVLNAIQEAEIETPNGLFAYWLTASKEQLKKIGSKTPEELQVELEQSLRDLYQRYEEVVTMNTHIIAVTHEPTFGALLRDRIKPNSALVVPHTGFITVSFDSLKKMNITPSFEIQTYE